MSRKSNSCILDYTAFKPVKNLLVAFLLCLFAATTASADEDRTSLSKECGFLADHSAAWRRVASAPQYLEVLSRKSPASGRVMFRISDSQNCSIEIEGTEIYFTNLYERIGYLLPPFDPIYFDGEALNTLAQSLRIKAKKECGQLSSTAKGNASSIQNQCVTKLTRKLKKGVIIVILQGWQPQKSTWEITVNGGKILGAVLRKDSVAGTVADIKFD